MRHYVLPFLAIAVIALMVYNEWTNDVQHHLFFDDVRGFISEGPRNTAKDGLRLCEEVNALIRHQSEHHGSDVVELDCDSIYGEKHKNPLRQHP